MIIANPIYDTVFKYLMSDTKNNIAKRFLEKILNVEILKGKDDFIKQLVHHSYFIQIPHIPDNPKTY